MMPYNAIIKVCPIRGICSDGRIDFSPEATDEQKHDANNLMLEWLANPEAFEEKYTPYSDKRAERYAELGVTGEALAVAIAEGIQDLGCTTIEQLMKTPKIQKLFELRMQVKTEIPKK